jgi:hypothetical protein
MVDRLDKDEQYAVDSLSLSNMNVSFFRHPRSIVLDGERRRISRTCSSSAKFKKVFFTKATGEDMMKE